MCSELELKPQGRLTVIVVRANDLKNKELIGKSDPYTVVYIRPLFKVKTKTIDNNLNPVWSQKFDLIVEDQETQALIIEVLISKLIQHFVWNLLTAERYNCETFLLIEPRQKNMIMCAHVFVFAQACYL